MAATLAEAIKAAEGPAFDAAVGYAVAAPRATPTDPGIATAFSRLDPTELRRLTAALSSREHRHPTEADDAIQDGFLELWRKEPELLLDASGAFLGHLYEQARRRLMDSQRERALSIEAVWEEREDSVLDAAKPCAPEAHSSEEQSRYVKPPAPGSSWSREQILGAIQRFRDHHGRSPRASDFRAINGLPSLTALYRHFASLADALLVAGMTPESSLRRRSWPPLAAAKECRAFKRRNGRWPYWRDVKSRPGELPSTTVMIRCFGGTRAIDVQLGAEAILAAVGEPTG